MHYFVYMIYIACIICTTKASFNFTSARDSSNFRGVFDDVRDDVRAVDSNSKPLSKIKTNSSVECMKKCMENVNCKSTNSNEQLELCELLAISLSHDGDASSVQAKTELGWKYQGYSKSLPIIYQQQDTITAEEKANCYEDQQTPGGEEPYCIRPFVFNGKPHISCSPGCVYGKLLYQPTQQPQCVSGIVATTRKSFEVSCKETKRKCPNIKSGNFWIKVSSDKLRKVYCDMETDGGGWLLIGSIKIDKESDVIESLSGSLVDYNNFDQIKPNNKLLHGNMFASLMDYMGIDEVRLFCTKSSHNRTVDIAIKNDNTSPTKEIFKYLRKELNDELNFCPSPFRYLPNDNSFFRQHHCSEFSSHLSSGNENGRLYSTLFYVPSKLHLMVGFYGRNDCDDFSQPGFSSTGRWEYFVR